MQQSALLITLNTVAKNKENFLENYYAKMKNKIDLGKTTAPYAYVIPAEQRKKSDTADLMNIVRREGVDVSAASQAFKAGNVDVEAGDYIVRIDQPYRGIVEMYLGLQWYPPNNPRPYDDTGWSIPLLRNIKVTRVDDKSILDQPMTTMTRERGVRGHDSGQRPHDRHRPHDGQQAGDVPVGERGGEDVGGRAGVRPGRPPLRGRRVRDSEREPRGARAADQRLGLPAWATDARADRADARPRRAAHRLHPLVAEHAGRGLGPHGPRHVQDSRTSTSATTKCGRATCARSTT